MVNEYTSIVIPFCVMTAIAFGAFALYLSRIKSGLHKNKSEDIDFFLTARNSQSCSRIAWSFYSATVGCWVLFVPSCFAVDPNTGSGWLGLLNYALFSGLPILLIAWTGGLIKKRYPTVLSIGDFVKIRYGQSVEIYITLLVLINTGIALAAEYTAIGNLFYLVLGSNRLLPVLLIGSITMIYCAAGGLYVSIITDKYQSIFSMILILITCVYVIFTFKPTDLPPLPPNLALNYYGYSSIATLGIALPAAAFFTDSMWQRVWSSENDRSLKLGALYGSLLTVLVVFTFGSMGYMATWAGLSSDPSTSFFSILKGSSEFAPVWIIVIVCVLAVTLSEAAVDSFQNAITSTVLSLAISFGFKVSIFHARLGVVLINIPLIIIGLQGYKITSLYLIMNILTTTSTAPIILGLLPQLDFYISGSAVLFGSAFSLSSVILYGYISTGSFLEGIYKYFYSVYAWEPFLIAVMSSILGVFIWVGIEIGAYACAGMPYTSNAHHHHHKDYENYERTPSQPPRNEFKKTKIKINFEEDRLKRPEESLKTI